MRKRFWVKTVLLAIGLIGLFAAMVLTINIDANAIAKKTSFGHSFIGQFVVAGGPIVWFILLPMSLVSGYVAAKYSLIIRRDRLLPEDGGKEILEMMQKSGSARLKQQLVKEKDLVSIAVLDAVTKSKGDWVKMKNVLNESLEEQAMMLLRGIEWLNLLGNVAPMVGLFGTVLGIIKMFGAIASAGGQPQAAQLAEGISVALVTTFWGLMIAIPALTVHGFFQNRIETFTSEAGAEADSILPQIIISCYREQQQYKQLKLEHSTKNSLSKDSETSSHTKL